MMGNFGESWTEWATASPMRWLTLPGAVALDAGQGAYNWATGTGASAPPAAAPDVLDLPGTRFTDEDFAPFAEQAAYAERAKAQAAADLQRMQQQRVGWQAGNQAPAYSPGYQPTQQGASAIPLVIAGGIGLALLLAAVGRRR